MSGRHGIIADMLGISYLCVERMSLVDTNCKKVKRDPYLAEFTPISPHPGDMGVKLGRYTSYGREIWM